MDRNYFINNCGVIETPEGIQRWSNRFKTYIPLKRTLNTRKHPNGTDKTYEMVSFYDREKKCGFSYPYHRFLWIWTYGDCPDGYDVDHIDHNSLNNDISNLQVISRKENLLRRKGKKNQYV